MPRVFPDKHPGKVVIESAGIPAQSKFNGRVIEIHILDGSGSMTIGHKFLPAVEGINTDLAASHKAYKETGIDGIYNVYQFGGSQTFKPDSKYSIHNQPISKLKEYPPHDLGGGTPLYQTITEAVTYWRKAKGPNDKILLKIFTDGQDTTNQKPIMLAQLLKDVEKEGFTNTFVGTAEDVKFITANLNIDESNTLVHDNTAMGVKISFEKMSTASTKYRSSLAKGMSVEREFYAKSMSKETK